MDPMRVPLAASMAVGRDDSFEQVLEQAIAQPEPEAPPADLDDQAPATEVVEESTQPEAEAPRERDELPAEPQPDANDRDPLATSHATGVAEADVTDSISRGEPERQETAGKGTDSPRTSRPTAEPLIAAVVQHGNQHPGTPFVVAGAERGIAAIGGARAAGDGPTRGIDGLQQRANAPLRAPSVAAAYRTDNAAQAELIEHARDSVFKQILLQLTGDGGEMRMRLQPPELGELDLRMVVEGGNKLSLTIAAERADLQQLLEKHLDELKQTLQQAGLEVTDAAIQSRSEFARDQQQRQQAADDGAAAAAADEAEHASPAVRRVTLGGSGLDFWA